MSARAAILGFIASLALAATAQASVIFSDLGSGYDCCTAYGVTGPYSFAGKASIAAQFTAPADDVISEIDVGMQYFGSGDDVVELALYSDSGGALGVRLASTVLTGLVDLGSSTATVAWSPVGIRVTANDPYWLYASAPGATIDLWNFNEVGASGPVYSPQYFGYAATALPAFDVLGGGAPIPEPTVWAMLILGVAMVGLAGRRQRLARPKARRSPQRRLEAKSEGARRITTKLPQWTAGTRSSWPSRL
jgi:hypothetical protein